MEDRQRVQQPVVGGEAPGVAQGRRVGGEVAVAEHGALGAAGGARGVEDGREVVLAARHVDVAGRGGLRPWPSRLPSPCSPRVSDVRHAELRGQLRHRLLELGPADEQGRLGVAQEVADLARGVGGVERQVDGAGAQAAEIEHQRLGALLDLGRDAVAGLDAQIQEHLGHAAGQVEQVGVAERAAVGRSRKARPRSAGKLRRKISNRFSFMRRSPGQAGWRAGGGGRRPTATTVPSLAKASWLASMKRRS